MAENDADQAPAIEVVPDSAEPLSVHDEAMLEVGRRLLVESVDSTKNFAQQMITVSTSAIPVYVALLGLADLRHRSTATLILVSLPSVAFLLAALCFVIAFLPRREYLSAQILDRIQEARRRLLQTRYRWTILGLATFGLGIVTSIVSVLALMSTH